MKKSDKHRANPILLLRAARSIRMVRYFLVALCAVFSLAWLSPASAAFPRATLIYGTQNITLVNTGAMLLNPNPLIFVRDSIQSPARFEAHDWGVPTLAPGECVQLRFTRVETPLPEACHSLVRWLWKSQRMAYFWTPAPGTRQFRIVAGSTDVAACDFTAASCTFSLEQAYRVETLVLTYTPDTLWVANGALTATSLAHLLFCRSSNGPQCMSPIDWRPAQPGYTIEPGQCIELSAALPTIGPPCPVVGLSSLPKPFWTQSFTVISPITARSTACPAARIGVQRCIVSR